MHEMEICDHCGSEFETGYWRYDMTLCHGCLLLAQELTAPSESLEVIGADDEDWDYVEPLQAEEVGPGTLGGYY